MLNAKSQKQGVEKGDATSMPYMSYRHRFSGLFFGQVVANRRMESGDEVRFHRFDCGWLEEINDEVVSLTAYSWDKILGARLGLKKGMEAGNRLRPPYMLVL